MKLDKTTIEKVRYVAEQASEEIMKYYRQLNFDIQTKSDQTPFTQADLVSQKIISSGLKQIADYPIIAEENYNYHNKTVVNSEYYWLVDPLDGTKDFIAHNDEFTIMIALINKNQPVVGLIYLPAQQIYYWAIKGQGAYKIDQRVFNHSRRTNLIAAASRFFRTKNDDDFFAKQNIKDVKTYGSSIKFCKLAEGEIDVYPRFNGTKEWDTAAGHLIANEAGCKVIDLKTKRELIYNKGNVQNNYFIASRNDLNFI